MSAGRPRGRLIALDGVDGARVLKEARALARAEGRRAGVSLWDASGIFTELAAGSDELERPSPRTLTLLYAADLAFRLRWQVRPALADGRIVIAAPYVATAIATGVAAGLPADWLDELFRFAPRPDSAARIPEKPVKRGARDAKVRAGGAGYVDFVCRELKRAGHGAGALRRDALAYLEERALVTASVT